MEKGLMLNYVFWLSWSFVCFLFSVRFRRWLRWSLSGGCSPMLCRNLPWHVPQWPPGSSLIRYLSLCLRDLTSLIMTEKECFEEGNLFRGIGQIPLNFGIMIWMEGRDKMFLRFSVFLFPEQMCTNRAFYSDLHWTLATPRLIEKQKEKKKTLILGVSTSLRINPET